MYLTPFCLFFTLLGSAFPHAVKVQTQIASNKSVLHTIEESLLLLAQLQVTTEQHNM